MRELAARGHTVVFATHHHEEADAVADRVVVVAGGRVVADGSATDVKASVNGRTISFTASPGRRLNGVPAVTAVTWHGDRVTLATDDAGVTLRALLAEGGLPHLEVRGASLEDAVLSIVSTGSTSAIGVAR
jgi:ABC-2 type transport system ATP-binding protein